MKKVVIIGAGIAGISSAVELCQSGFEVILIEQKPQIGGRIYSIADKASGDLIDNGQHLLTGAYHRFMEILKILGTADKIKQQKSIIIPFYSKSGNITLDSSKFPGSMGMLYGLLALKSVSFKSKLAAVILMIKIKAGFEGDTDVGCDDFLKRHKQGEDLIELFWEPLILATINADINTASAKLLVNVLRKAFLAGRQSAALMFPKTDLSDLLQPLEYFLQKNNSKLIKSAKASKLNIVDRNCIGVELATGELIASDALILAVPPYSIHKLLPVDSKLYDFVHNLSYSPIISVYFWFEDDLFDFDFAGIIGYDSQWIFNRRKIIEINNSKFRGHITVTVSAANELMKMSLDAIANHVFAELKIIFNLRDEIKPTWQRVIIEKFATPLISSIVEGQRPSECTDIRGLYVAGDWCDTGLPATIEGAALSGLNAAAMIKEKFV